MKRVGIAELPLHHGHAPRWLFSRMVKLGREMVRIIIIEQGADEFLKKLSSPLWFQAFSCVLGFDWHSSGTTTVTMGALKEALKDEELGIKIVGGKGIVARKTLEEIEKACDSLNLHSSTVSRLKYASRMAAKVDNVVLQDGFKLYHHSFILSEDGKWAVIQQGLNENARYARRYHWLSTKLSSFVEEPHNAIVSDIKKKVVLDMTAKESEEARKVCVDIAQEGGKRVKRLVAEVSREKEQATLNKWLGKERPAVLFMPRRINWRVMDDIYDIKPRNYEELVSIKGVGANIVRALALISEVIYEKPVSISDPVKYTYAHGGKDGVPYPVDRKTYDKSISILRQIVEEARIGNKEKLRALARLKRFSQAKVF